MVRVDREVGVFLTPDLIGPTMIPLKPILKFNFSETAEVVS